MLLGLAKMCLRAFSLNENLLEPVDSCSPKTCCSKIISHMKCKINLGIFISCESCPGGQLPIWEKSMIFLSNIKCTGFFCSSLAKCIAIISRPKTAGNLTVIENVKLEFLPNLYKSKTA